MGTDTNNNQAVDKTDEKVTFSSEQQAKVDELIRQAQGRAAKEVREKLEETENKYKSLFEEHNQIKSQFEEFKTKRVSGDKEEFERVVGEHRRKVDELTNILKVEKDKTASVQNELLNERKNNAIRAAAASIGFVNMNLVAKDTSDSIQWDSEAGRFVVMENGVPKRNSAYEFMGLEEFYKDYAQKNPYLVKADSRGGAGSSEPKSALTSDGQYKITDIFGKESNAKKANELAIKNPAEYKRLKAEAIKAGLI